MMAMTALWAGCMNLHCVPTGPNRSRVTYEMFSTNENKFTKYVLQSVMIDLSPRPCTRCMMVSAAPLWGSQGGADVLLHLMLCRMGEKIPAFLDHQQRNLVFDGDHALLHIQVC